MRPSWSKLSSHIEYPYNCPHLFLSVRSRPLQMYSLFFHEKGRMAAINDFMWAILFSFVFRTYDNSSSRNTDPFSGPCNDLLQIVYYYRYQLNFLVFAQIVVGVSSSQSLLVNPHQPLHDLSLVIEKYGYSVDGWLSVEQRFSNRQNHNTKYRCFTPIQ